ncbi:MAG: hypothetical protein WD114_05050 [Phycisphaerales bacterium]
MRSNWPRQRVINKLAVSIVLGSVLCALITALLLTYLRPTNWVSRSGTLPLSEFEPTYLEPIAPELGGVFRFSPSTGNGSFLVYRINVGSDMMNYSYGFPEMRWDPARSESPSAVQLRRYRFGWPMRFLSYDEISTGASVNNPVVMAYHKRAYALAGARRGLDRPSWLPEFIPLFRVPTAVEWLPLAINLLLWSLAAFLLLAMSPLLKHWIRVRRFRRGVCVKCCYPLEELLRCPECGQER